MRTKRRRAGLTLAEFMVGLILLCAVVVLLVPTVGARLQRAREATTRANLGLLRSALAAYSADNGGHFPTDHLDSLTYRGRYLATIPPAHAFPDHPESRHVDTSVELGPALIEADTGSWVYLDDADLEEPGGPKKGDVWIGCTHPGSDGRPWSTY